jgi:hypothetical protein
MRVIPEKEKPPDFVLNPQSWTRKNLEKYRGFLL